MAGIGFSLKKMFTKETFSSRALAYVYSSFIAAGPWIISVISINLLLVLMKLLDINNIERDLFSATIVYSFLFSQILVAPLQLVVTRYISDKLFNKEYDVLKPTFIGVNNIVSFLSVIVCVVFYANISLPLYYKILSSFVFILISMIWVIMIFLSAVKNYKLIGIAYILGGLVTVALSFYLIENPIVFNELGSSTNFLLSYVVGLSTIFIILLYTFFSTFHSGNPYTYDFIRFFGKHAVLSFIGLFYTCGLWVDNIIVWFSDYQVRVFDVFVFAPYYDNVVFLSYLTTIVTLVLFLVIIETEFYKTYKDYFGNVNSIQTLKEIEKSKHRMIETLSYHLIYTFMIQLLINITLVLLANPIFRLLNINYLIRDMFKITAIGALFNISAFIIILVLLYFEKRKSALLIAGCFFTSNTLLTLFFNTQPLKYTGYGFAIASAFTFFIALIPLFTYFKNINYETFALQPLYLREPNDIFVKIANRLNRRSDKKHTAAMNKKRDREKKLSIR